MKSPIKPKMHTVFVHVSDLYHSVEWYHSLLDLPYNQEDVSLPVYNMPMDTYTGLVLDAGPEGNKKNTGLSPHPLFNLHTDDIDEAYQFVVDKGMDIASPISRFDDISFFDIKDPDGNVVMICTG